MSYAPYSPSPPTPQQLLADPAWRRRQSSWLLLPTLGICCLGWAGFVIVAIRTGRRRYWVYAGIYAVVSFGSLILGSEFETDSWQSDTMMGIYFVSVIVIVAHAFLINGEYVQIVAHRQPWMLATTPVPGHQPPPGFLGLNQPQAFWGPGAAQQPPPASMPQRPPAQQRMPTPSVPTSPIDINTATAEDFATLPGVDVALGESLVRLREQGGGFTAVDELMTRGGLQPHQWLRVRDYVRVQPDRQPPPQQPPAPGRILDL